MLRLLICGRADVLSTVRNALDSNDALTLQDDLPDFAAFPSEEDVDVEVVPVGPGLGLRMSQMPALVVADEDESTDGDARNQATWLISALERRETAIRRVAEVILASSADYFLGKSDRPSLVSLDQLADRSGLQTTSVERVLKHKRIASPRGRQPLSDFVA